MSFKFLTNKHFLLSLLFVAFLGGVISQFIRVKGHKENDHWVYYRTAERIQNNDVMEFYTRKDGALPFRYSPPTLMLFSWMSNFTETTSRKIWLLVQAACILASLRLLYIILIELGSTAALSSITLSFLLFYRYFLDTLYCGQVAGVAFLAFTLGLYYWVKNEKEKSNFPLLFLCLLKIIPGFLIMINFLNSKSWKELFKQFLSLTLVVFTIHLVFLLWFIAKFGQSNITEIIPMYKSWISIVGADSDYFDGSTLKSQALRSVLLRMLGVNEESENIWRIISMVSFLGLFIFWYKTKMGNLKVRVYSYCLGVLAFVMLMPQSLPYQFFKLLIPLIFIVNEFLISKKKRYGVILFFVLIFCSLSTADLIGHIGADAIQYESLPFLCFVLMGGVILREILSLQKTSDRDALT